MGRVNPDRPHRRYNPLTEEWVLVSPHRAERPWGGMVESAPPVRRPAYDPSCYLCPGNRRASESANPRYEHTFVFENDFPALLPETAAPSAGPDATGGENTLPESAEECNGLVRWAPESGICRVACFSPRHDLTLAEMDAEAVRRVVDLWVEQYIDLGSRDFVSHVLIFENKGALMGCSNPHPHSQIWATQHVPFLAARKIESQARYFRAHGSHLLMDYLKWELGRRQRIVSENESLVALVPFWAVWPFELMIVPRRPAAAVSDLTGVERSAWASLLLDATTRYDNLFRTSFPYSMGINQMPTDGAPRPGVVWHQSFYPPLLRSATVRKFLVGYEMSGEPQRDITPEQAAGRLRECGGKHYLAGNDWLGGEQGTEGTKGTRRT